MGAVRNFDRSEPIFVSRCQARSAAPGRAGRRGLGAGLLSSCVVFGMMGWLLLGVISCGQDWKVERAEDPRPNVLLISIDTLRADHLSTYGYFRETSPRLSELARAGLQVQVAYAPSATTGPTHASLFTARPPMAHGVRKNGQPLPEQEQTLAERLQAIGFETGAVVSSYVLSDRFGYDQGFQAFNDDFSQAQTPMGSTVWEGETIEERFYGRADDTTDRALAWLQGRQHKVDPFFLFVHYYDPHDPYLPPEGFTPPFAPGRKEALKLNRTIYLYDLLVAYTDQQIGRLLDGLAQAGLTEDTLVIVTGDHGEGLMTHGHMYHGLQVYEEAVRIPLVLRWPGRIQAGKKVEEPFSLVELAPAVLEMLGDSPDGPLRTDNSAARLLGQGREEANERPIFLYRRHYEGDSSEEMDTGARGEKYGVRFEDWKLIVGPEEGTLELYDLVGDPLEKNNVASSEPERVEALLAMIEQWRTEHEPDAMGAPKALSTPDRERLKALGYVE